MNATNLAAIAPSLPSQGSVKDVRAYLASLSKGASRASMHSPLDRVARILTGIAVRGYKGSMFCIMTFECLILQ